MGSGCGGVADAPPVHPGQGPPPEPTRGEVLRGRIAYVSDGDTIGVRFASGGVVRVRLLGIDAPETKDPDRPVACYGPQASARASLLMPRGRSVTIVTDPTQDRIDTFGRLLAYVFATGDPVPFNEQLVSDGAARTYVYRRNRPPRRIGAFRDAERLAQAAKRGLWGACPSG
jgi:micrococcal nuclease